jgi:hypothetical protein
MRIPIRLKPVFAVAAIAMGVAAPPAPAATPAPGFAMDSFAIPTDFSAADSNAYKVTVTNAGSQPSDGSTIKLSDKLPAGLTALGAVLTLGGSCEWKAANVECEYPGVLAPDETLTMEIGVGVDPNASGPVTNTATVSGGGALEASVSGEIRIAHGPPPFGLTNFDFYAAGLDGARDFQAGGHPYELTTTIDMDNALSEGKTGETVPTSVEDLKDVVVDLPLGFAGSTLAAPECTLEALSSEQGCPPNTRVGHLLTEPETVEQINSPIWNMVPEHGAPAEFGYIDGTKGSHVLYVHVVPTPAGYVLRVTSPDIPQVALSRIVATFYGNPAAKDATGGAPIPFFTDPTACGAGPLKATVYVDSWQKAGSYNADGTPDLVGDPNWVKMTSESPPVIGCNELDFTPELKAQPTTTTADSPSGLEFELKLPQTEDAGVPATPALKTATVTLPEGMTVDPSSGNGLAVCSEAQIGWLGGTPRNFSPAQPECPEASKIGSLELTTPLLPVILNGALYLARQDENPFGSVLAAYVVVNDPVTGVLIKLAGRFLPNPQTGRMTAVFEENPQLPFSDLKLHFFGGPRAELTTPESCGAFTTISDLEAWSAPDSGPDGTPFDTFTIDSGCVNGFAPVFTGGSPNLQAGAYTPFVASFSRQDTDQELAGLSVSLPPGLLADVGTVPLCPEAEANAGTCPQSTQVGTVNAGAGPGPNPLFVGGKVYLTGPYNGGPYGLSVVVPAIAGPFNFGDVVVRQSLRIDPTDAHVTDVSDPFPTILNPTGADGQTIGIPIRLRRIDVSIDRPGFTFNPTNCGKLQVGGSITSTQGQSSALAVPFQVTNCATLKFAPKFAVSTSGQTSRTQGASLSVKLTYPNVPQGTQANIARVKVELPKQLPSRLTTLQKACTAAQFEANPAGCPAASIVGHAKAVTPILPVPLEGPAYFVSHGGEAFPSLIMVLQGNGVTLDLVGSTFIDKAGITSSTFKTVPDAPVGSFELTLPEGQYSALAANGNLCKSKLTMPTEFVAQNGAEIHQTTAIAVTGCKPAIGVLRHAVRGRTATIAVSVPSAGRLVATGAGLSRAVGKAAAAGTVTVRLTLSNREQRFLSRHPGRRLKATVRLLFTPKSGGKLSSRVTLLMR